MRKHIKEFFDMEMSLFSVGIFIDSTDIAWHERMSRAVVIAGQPNVRR